MRGINPTQVPTVPVEINWGHPLAEGLVFCVIPGIALIDLAGSSVFNPGTSQTIGASDSGPGLYFPSTTQTAPYAPVTPKLQLSTVSLVWRGTILAYLASNFGLLGAATGNPGGVPSAPYNPWEVYYNTGASGVVTFSIIAANTSSDGTANFNFDLSIGQEVSLAASFDMNATANSYAAYANGIAQTLSSSSLPSSGTYSWTGSEIIYVGGDWREAAASTSQGLIYNRIINGVDAAWLQAEPFAMLKPIIRRKYYLPQSTSIIKISSLGEIFGESGQSQSGFVFGNSVGENSSYPLTNLLGELALTSVGGQFAQEVSDGELISQIYIQQTEENYSKTSNSVNNTISSTDISVGSGSAVASPYVPVLLISSESQSVSQGSANPYVNSYVFAISETSGFSGQSIVLSASIEALGETTSDIAVQAYVESHVINIGSEEIAVSYGGFDNIKRYSNAEYLLLPFKNFNQISIG